VTLVDRLVHRAEIIAIEGESFRLKEAKERAAKEGKGLIALESPLSISVLHPAGPDPRG
jgi:hypothetical protein